jgi:hypothetical protein
VDCPAVNRSIGRLGVPELIGQWLSAFSHKDVERCYTPEGGQSDPGRGRLVIVSIGWAQKTNSWVLEAAQVRRRCRVPAGGATTCATTCGVIPAVEQTQGRGELSQR